MGALRPRLLRSFVAPGSYTARMPRFFSVVLALAACAALNACSTPTSVALFAGPLSGGFSTARLTLPAGLRDDSVSTAPTLRSVPCGGGAPACPSVEGADRLVLECVAGVCDPAPKTLVAPLGDVVDLDESAGDLSGLLSSIDRVEVTEIDATVLTNTLTVDIEPIDVFWGPEGASSIDEMRHLATLPAIPAGANAIGPVVLDAGGVDGLSDHLVGTSRRARFFVRTRVDLAPGARYPEGAIELEVVVSIRATGTIAG